MTQVLIVDDSPIARRIIRSCFPAGQWQFDEASNGQEAVDKVRNAMPDLIFLDLTMPVMGGIEALEIIKSETADVRVVVATADVQKKVLTQVMQLGASTLIKKPPTKETVAKALDLTLGGSYGS